MPDCYYRVSSDLEEAGGHFQQAVNEADGEVGDGKRGDLTLKTDGSRVYAFVRYDTRGDAAKRHGKIRSKIASSHRVEHDAILEDFEELGLKTP